MINIRKLFEPTDMTIGTPWKSIALFSVPMLIGNIAQQLYSTVDSIVVGHYVGDNALASVGSAAPLFNMLLVLFVGISAGVGIMVSQYFGAKAREELSHTIGTCITMTALVSLVLMLAAPPFIRSMLITLIILLFGKYLMMIFTDTAELVNLSVRVMRILAAGYIAVAVTQSLSGVMRGAGDTVTPMVISLITTIVIRVPVAYGLSYLTRTPDLPVGRFESIPVSLLICWLMGAVLTTIFYKVGRWKKTSLQ